MTFWLGWGALLCLWGGLSREDHWVPDPLRPLAVVAGLVLAALAVALEIYERHERAKRRDR